MSKRIIIPHVVYTRYKGKKEARGEITADVKFLRHETPLVRENWKYNLIAMEPDALEDIEMSAVFDMYFFIRADYPEYGGITIHVDFDDFIKYSFKDERGVPDKRLQYFYSIKNHLKRIDNDVIKINNQQLELF